MSQRTFCMPSSVLLGMGASERIGESCLELNGGKCLIVTDEVLLKLGALSGIEESLSSAGVAQVIFSGVFTEPTVDFVNNGLKAYQENGCEFLLAVGGGSAIDTAKGISVMATNPGKIADYQGIGKVICPGAPLICVPTTAGTGSEVTQFTILTDTERGVKMLIASPYLIPDRAIVDPMLTLSMPRSLTAATGIDALTHAIEAYVSVKAQPTSDIFALSAINLISGNLRQAWANGQNQEAREKMMLASMYAGIALSNSSATLLHGMSRPIGAYFHVAHGVSNAALLNVVTEFSLIGNPARYARIAEAMGENIDGLSLRDGAEVAAEAIGRLIEDVEIPSLCQLGVDGDKLDNLAPEMAEAALASGSPGNNPRQATKEEIIKLYKLAYSH